MLIGWLKCNCAYLSTLVLFSRTRESQCVQSPSIDPSIANKLNSGSFSSSSCSLAQMSVTGGVALPLPILLLLRVVLLVASAAASGHQQNPSPLPPRSSSAVATHSASSHTVRAASADDVRELLSTAPSLDGMARHYRDEVESVNTQIRSLSTSRRYSSAQALTHGAPIDRSINASIASVRSRSLQGCCKSSPF